MLNNRFGIATFYFVVASFLGHHLLTEANDDADADWAMSAESELGFEAMASDDVPKASEQQQDQDLPGSTFPQTNSEPAPAIQSHNEDAEEQDRTQQRKFVQDMMADLPRNDPFYEYCTGEPDSGICTGNFTRYAFSINQGECVPFSWGGCGGNLNNYERQGTCLEVCLYAAQKRAMAYSIKYKALAYNREQPAPVQITKLQAATSQVTVKPITI